MKKKMTHKLKSQSGASLVLAILVFLVCAMIGSTILAAASSSSGTLTNTWQDDSNVYLLKSAESLFGPAFEGRSWSAAGRTDSNDEIQVPSSSTLETLYEALSAKTYNDGSASQSIVMTLGNTTAATDPVAVSIVMDDSYNVTAVFTKANTERKLLVYIAASAADSTTTKGKGAQVSWGSPVITVQ